MAGYEAAVKALPVELGRAKIQLLGAMGPQLKEWMPDFMKAFNDD